MSSIFALCLDTCIDFPSPSQIKILAWVSNGAILFGACHERAEVINVGRQQPALEVFSHVQCPFLSTFGAGLKKKRFEVASSFTLSSQV